MRRRFVFFFALVLILAVSLLIFFLNKVDKEEKLLLKEEKIEQDIDKALKYIEDNNIKKIVKVKLTNTNEVLEMTENDYLEGVLPSEMPPEYDIEALKAQVVVARTYLYNKMNTNAHKDADICDDPSHCQAFYTKDQIKRIWKNSKGWDDQKIEKYANLVKKAVEDTEHIVITYNGKYIKAYYHACSGGKTENVYNIWGKQKIPYLVSVESIEDTAYKNYYTKVTLTISELQAKLNKSSSIKCNINKEGGDIVQILSYTDTGRVDKVKIGGVIYTAEKLRTILGLRSTNFNLSYDDKKVNFHVTGNGHGVGMSQTGADYYASTLGYTYDQIITHYYKGVDVTYVNQGGNSNENKI